MTEEERFQQAKIDLQDDSFLASKAASITRRLTNDDPTLDHQSAHMMALSILAMPLRGSTSLTEDEMKDAINEMTGRLLKYSGQGMN